MYYIRPSEAGYTYSVPLGVSRSYDWKVRLGFLLGAVRSAPRFLIHRIVGLVSVSLKLLLAPVPRLFKWIASWDDAAL